MVLHPPLQRQRGQEILSSIEGNDIKICHSPMVLFCSVQQRTEFLNYFTRKSSTRSTSLPSLSLSPPLSLLFFFFLISFSPSFFYCLKYG